METLYQSTRDHAGGTATFVQALHRGLAPDGGLYVPTTVPRLPGDWSSTGSFEDLAASVLGAWLEGVVDPEAVSDIARDAFNFSVPLVPLSGPWEGVHVLELFHGPTLSFKDFGARAMARLMAATLPAGSRLTILVATSGDTGSAVADGFSGIPGIRVVLLYPKGQVSPIQEQQLIVERPGVAALRVEGTFDDCQRMVKAAFREERLVAAGLSSANSINIGRLIPQSLYYVWAANRLHASGIKSGPARICVPSGNLGNLTAAVLAQAAGLPVAGFVAAHNANAFFPDYLAGSQAPFPASVQTLSNAMDVGAPSNFERLEFLLGRKKLAKLIEGASVSDQDTLASMRRVHDETGYLADPHTAVGLEAVRRLRGAWPADQPVVVASTAHAAKFPEAVTRAIAGSAAVPVRLARFWDRPVAVRDIAAEDGPLREVILEGTTTG